MIKKNSLKRLSIAAAVLGLAVGGTTVVANNYVNASNSTSTQTSSKSISTSKIKITQDEAIKKFTEKYGDKSIKSIELEAYRGTYVYTIEGFDSSKEYIVSVDAETGKVLRSNSKDVDKDDKNTALDLDKLISRSEATKIAQSKASGTAVEWELETKDGKAVWTVELVSDSKRSKVEIDATSKSVLNVDTSEAKKSSFKKDGFRGGAFKGSREKATSVPSNAIKATEAISIAQGKVSGTVVEARLEKDDSNWIWKVELVSGSKETEVKINATTKKVISVQTDSDQTDSQDESDD